MKTLCLKLSLLLGALLTVSCTYQSTKSLDCMAPVTLHLSYVDKTGKPSLEDYLKNTDMYLFAADDTFIRKYSFTRAQSIDPAGIPMLLPEGEYRIVTWGNVGTRTSIMPADPVKGTAASVFSLFNTLLNADLPTTDTIFFNSTGFTVQDDEPQVIPVPLRRESCYIHVDLTGYASQGQPYIRLVNMTNGYNFSAHVQGVLTNYKPIFRLNPTSGEYSADFAILRPKNTDQIFLELYDGTQTTPIMSLDLSRARNVNLETETEPELTIELSLIDNNRIAVSVNDWNAIIDIHIEL